MATAEEELKRLERELRQTSMMTSTVRSAQSRFISTMTRHSDAVSKSIITTLQEIKGSSDNTKISKKRLEVLQKQLEKAQQDLTATNARITALRSITARTTEQEKELKKLITAEERQKTAVDNLTDEIKAKTEELKYVKFQTLATTVTALAGGMMSLAASVRETQQRFGITADQVAGLQFGNLKKSISSYVDALTGRGPAATMEQIAATQEAFQQQFGGVLDPEAAKRLTQEAIKMGVTAEQMADARRVFMTQTGGDLNKATKQTDKFIGEFKKKGLTAKDAMQAIQQNSELLARNGARFAGSFARAAADAVKIGVNLSKISQVGDNIISDFEGFLESQAELGAMGFGFDSSRLAEIAETGSDADLFNELRSQLSATGKDINKLRRSERLALESAFGINISEMQKLAIPPGEEGSGEKTMEQYQETTNSLLTTMVGVLEGVGKGFAVIGSVISGIIAASTAITAANTTAIVTAMGATIPAILTGILSALTPLVGIGATLALIWGAVKLFKLGSENVEEGRKKIKTGQQGGTGQLIKGRAEQGAGVGAATVGTISALTAGALLTASGVGAGIGIPLILAAAGTGAAAGGLGGGTLGAARGAIEAGNLKRTKGDDVVSKPGYGKRALLTPSGIIALNNKDNIVAYADDMVGTQRLPYGSIAKKVADDGSKYGPLISSLFERGTNLSGGKGRNALGHLLGMATGKLGLSTGKYDFIPRTVRTLFGNVSKFAPGLTKLAAQNVKALPVIGSLLGGGLTGYDEYKKSGSLLRGVGKGLFSAAGGTLGSIGGGAATLGNPIVASAGGIAGSLGGEMAFDSMMGIADDYISYADDLMGGKKLPLGTISKMFSTYKEGGFGGVKSSLMNTGLGMLGKRIPGFSGAMNAFSAYKKGGITGLMGSLAKGGAGRGIGAAIGTAIPIPFVGTAVGSLVGSKLGKLAGGLFGRKKQQATTISPEMMQAGTMPDLSTFLGSQSQGGETRQSAQTPVTVDTRGIEQKLNNFINALQNIQIHMDGSKVGKVLVNTTDVAMSTGVFRAQSR